MWNNHVLTWAGSEQQNIQTSAVLMLFIILNFIHIILIYAVDNDNLS